MGQARNRTDNFLWLFKANVKKMEGLELQGALDAEGDAPLAMLVKYRRSNFLCETAKNDK